MSCGNSRTQCGKEQTMFFSKKKKETAPQGIPDDMHQQMYETWCEAVKKILSAPDCTMTAEEVIARVCPASIFSDEELAQMCKEVSGQ